jgi:hypothetical protein
VLSVKRLAAWLVLGVASLCAAADGPYVVRTPGGGWQALSVETAPDGARKRVTPLGAKPEVTVPGVGTLPSFRVALRDPASTARHDLEVASRYPLFVVADTHGEFEILAAQLQKHGVIDAKLAWKFGRGHLVVLGDAFDRGPNHTEILWLLYKLEAEAARAGGGSHFVLGNHETMVMNGDLRYLHPRYEETTRVLGLASYSELFDVQSLLGQWLRARPTLLKINDQLFLHGGVSRALVDSGMTLTEINATMRALLSGSVPVTTQQRQRAELLMGSLGPLWYRGYFEKQAGFPSMSPKDLDSALAAYGVRRILIGHTIVPTITPLFGGKVIAVQVYPKHDDAGNTSFESLLVRSGELWRAGFDGGLQRLDIMPAP